MPGSSGEVLQAALELEEFVSAHGQTRAEPVPRVAARLRLLEGHDAPAAATATRAVELAMRTVPRAITPDGTSCFTLRRPADGSGARPEGTSPRYAAIVALGAARLSVDEQRTLLHGRTAVELCLKAAEDLGRRPELGDLAMTAWASLEAQAPGATVLVDRVPAVVASTLQAPTVAWSWALTALTAAGRTEQARALAGTLLAVAGPTGLFPHWVQPDAAPRWRRHVGCFADQVYPVLALARYAALTGDEAALTAAQRCADAICALQGPAGQWWWHYDVRTGAVVEGYPVYAVHQAGMAPMALLDLQDAGGRADLGAIARGLHWLQDPPEADSPLIDEAEGLVWRKVGRREVAKGVRALRSAGSAVSPRVRLRLLDRLCPPGPVDHESRPYEAGWALYAWHRSS